MKKIVLYATGKLAEEFMELIDLIEEVTIVKIVDSNAERWGSLFCGHVVHSPQSIKNTLFDGIIIGSNSFKEILLYLTNSLRVELSLIIPSPRDYLRDLLLEQQYRKLNNSRSIKRKGTDLKGKGAIYTAVYGNYDCIQEPKYVSENFDYICFTDNVNVTSNVWKCIYISGKCGNDNNRNAKYFKILPHKFLENYSWSIWVDANIEIFLNLQTLFNPLDNENLALILHPERVCTYKEAEKCIISGKGNKLIIENQMYEYEKEGFPHNAGLFCGGVIFRNHNDYNIQCLMNEWWQEIETKSSRDQLSLSYILWKKKIDYDIINVNIFSNPFFNINKHIEDSFQSKY